MNEEIIKTYSLEEELEFYDVEPDDYQILSDGSEGYFVVLFSNLDEEQNDKLRRMGYYKINGTDDLWWRRLENPFEIPDEKIIELHKFKKAQYKKYIL